MKSGTNNTKGVSKEASEIFEQIEGVNEAVNRYFEINNAKQYDRKEYEKVINMEEKLGKIVLNIRGNINNLFVSANKKIMPVTSNVIDFNLNKFIANDFKVEKNGSVIKIKIPPLLHKKVYKKTQISEKYYEDYYTNELVDGELYAYLRNYKLTKHISKYKEKVLIYVKNVISTNRKRNDIPDTDNHEYHDLINTITTVFLEDDSPEHAAFMFDTEYGSTNKTEIYIIPYSEPEEIMRVALEAPASAQSENKEKKNIIDFRLAV